MASFKFFVMLAVMGMVYKIIRSVLQNSDVIEQGRKALGLPDVKPPAATRPAPPATPAAGAKRPAQTWNRPASGSKVTNVAFKTARAPARAQDNALNAWYFVLDVSPDADRSEINEALRLRLSRARAAGDRAAMQQLMRAAAIGLRQPRREVPATTRPRDAMAAR
jgi:hypothetical protein